MNEIPEDNTTDEYDDAIADELMQRILTTLETHRAERNIPVHAHMAYALTVLTSMVTSASIKLGMPVEMIVSNFVDVLNNMLSVHAPGAKGAPVIRMKVVDAAGFVDDTTDAPPSVH